MIVTISMSLQSMMVKMIDFMQKRIRLANQKNHVMILKFVSPKISVSQKIEMEYLQVLINLGASLVMG